MKNTRAKLISSVAVLLICFAMLIGSTFAWFTDSASTGVNKIQAGNLDIEVFHSNKTVTNEAVADTTTLFTDVIKWEPGAVAYENITIKNVGNLSAKIKLNLKDVVKNSTNDGHDLTEVIKIAVVEGGFSNPDRDSILESSFDSFSVVDKDFNLDTTDNAEKTYGIALYWQPTDHDNDYNVPIPSEELYIQFGLEVFATQGTVENDSFDEFYDKDAPYTVYEVTTQEEFANAVNSHDEYILVRLCNDITVNIGLLGEAMPESGEYRLGGVNTKEIVISGNSKKLVLNTTYMSALGMNNPQGKLCFENITLNSTGNSSNTWNIYDFQIIGCNLEMNNVVMEKALAINNAGKKSILENIVINETQSNANAYALWICAGGDVIINNSRITGYSENENIKNRAIKIADQYVANPQLTKLVVNSTTFKSQKKAAVLVTSTAGASIVWGSENDIENVIQDKTNAVWVDTERSAYDSLVTVSGCTKIIEQ